MGLPVVQENGSVNKANWDEGMSVSDKHLFNRRWIRLCKESYQLKGLFGYQNSS